MTFTTYTLKIDDIKLTAKYFNARFAKDEQGSKKPVLFCLPGGGTSAEFFDLAPDFSFTERMTAKGYDVLTMDHLGTATNPLPEYHPFLTPHQSANYIAQTLIKWIPQERKIIGIGHSMGGMIITLIQAAHRPFHALSLLGSNAGGLEWGLNEDEKKYINRQEDLLRDLKKLTLNKFNAEFTAIPSGPSGKSITFSGETPALTKRLQEITCALFGAGGIMSMTRGSFRTEVNTIDVPLFFAFGDHDIGIPPEDVPKDYINVPSTKLIVLKDTGHNSLAFSSIKKLCETLDHWLSSLSAVSRNL